MTNCITQLEKSLGFPESEPRQKDRTERYVGKEKWGGLFELC